MELSSDSVERKASQAHFAVDNAAAKATERAAPAIDCAAQAAHQTVFEILGSVRALVADEADLLAAEANVAVRTLVACVIIAVAAAALGVLGIAALLAIIAMQIVESGYSWPVALGCVFLTCALGSAALVFMLRGLTLHELFVASRGELRGKA